MKAIILAAGRGERLGDLTSTRPKPMIMYEGKPLLEHNITLCREAGVRDIYINLHHLPDVITGYFGDGSRFGVRIRYTLEEELLGTAGAVGNIRDLYPDEFSDAHEYFLVLYGDNVSSIDLASMIDVAHRQKALAVVAFHFRNDTGHSGVAEFDAEERIVRFIEKPDPGETESHWVNAGIYCLQASIMDRIPSGFSDFARDVFPAMLQNAIPIIGMRLQTDVKAFDTPDMYQKHQKDSVSGNE